MHDTRTRSPTASVVTAEPISTIVPTASCPRIVPAFTSGTSPLRMWRSVPQIVEESMRTIASVGSCSVGIRDGVPAALARPVVDERFHRDLLWSLTSMLAEARRSESVATLRPVRVIRRYGVTRGRRCDQEVVLRPRKYTNQYTAPTMTAPPITFPIVTGSRLSRRNPSHVRLLRSGNAGRALEPTNRRS